MECVFSLHLDTCSGFGMPFLILHVLGSRVANSSVPLIPSKLSNLYVFLESRSVDLSYNAEILLLDSDLY